MRSVVKVRPGKMTRYPWSIARSKVEILTGEKRAAWAKATRAGALGLPMAVAA